MSPPVQPLTPRRTANQRRVEEELQRWKDETAWELETQNDAIRQYQANTARNVRALEPGLARVPDPTVLEPVDSRPELHGPTPRGMRPSRLPARRGFLTEEQAKDLDDPYMNESDLYRRLAVLRYKGVPGAIMGAYQTGYETMVGVENLLGKIPYAGAPFRWLAEASHPGIDRVRAEEAVMRERHMGPVERGVTGLIRGVAEFELGTRALGPLGSILRAEAPVVAATQGARTRLGHFGARALAEAKNTLLRGSAAAAQFGAYEQGLATLQGESVEEAARRGREGAGTGALLGGGLPLAFKGLLKGAEGAARVARPVAKPLYEGFQETLRTGARGLLYTDARIREAAELRRATRNFTQGETVYWQGRAYKWDGKLGRAEDGTATVSLSTGHAGPDDVNNPWYPSEPAAPLTEVTRTPSGEPVIGMTPMAEGRVAERSRRIRESMEAELAERRQPVPSPDEARGMDYSDLAERLSPANRQRFRVGEDLHPVDEQGQPDHAARELIRRGVSGTAAAEAEAAAPAPPPGTKVRKGIYYFDYYQSARAYAEAHGLPTDRIIQYKRGWAVQLEKGGDYAGPRTPPRETPPPEQAGRGKGKRPKAPPEAPQGDVMARNRRIRELEKESRRTDISEGERETLVDELERLKGEERAGIPEVTHAGFDVRHDISNELEQVRKAKSPKKRAAVRDRFEKMLAAMKKAGRLTDEEVELAREGARIAHGEAEHRPAPSGAEARARARELLESGDTRAAEAVLTQQSNELHKLRDFGVISKEAWEAEHYSPEARAVFEDVAAVVHDRGRLHEFPEGKEVVPHRMTPTDVIGYVNKLEKRGLNPDQIGDRLNASLRTQVDELPKAYSEHNRALEAETIHTALDEYGQRYLSEEELAGFKKQLADAGYPTLESTQRRAGRPTPTEEAKREHPPENLDVDEAAVADEIRERLAVVRDIESRLEAGGRGLKEKKRNALERELRNQREIVEGYLQEFEDKFGPEARARLEESSGYRGAQADLSKEVQRALSMYEKALPDEKGEGLRATVQNVRNAIDKFLERGVPEDDPYLARLKRLVVQYGQKAETPPKPKGKATAERLEEAFQRGKGDVHSALEGVQEAAATSKLPLSAEDRALVGKKQGLKRNALDRELAERFGESLNPRDKATAPRTFAEAVERMDEQLTKSEPKHYDVSRYGTGDISDARLPDEFHEESWSEKGNPTAADLREQAKFGSAAQQTIRRMETASARAARDAEIVAHLSGKADSPGVTRAREIASELANKKESMTQQIENAIVKAEKLESESARGKASDLQRDITTARISKSDWEGNRIEDGEWITNGHIMFRRADLEANVKNKKRLEHYTTPSESRASGAQGIPQSAAAKIFQEAVEKADAVLEFLGHLAEETREKIARAYLVPEGKNTGLRAVNSAYLRRLQEITRFDEIRGYSQGRGVAERPIVLYRDGNPVAVMMPIRMTEIPFNVEEARAHAGNPVPPPKRSGRTTKVKGLTVHEPTTSRGVMEPGYEEPQQLSFAFETGEAELRSTILPDTGKPSMTDPAEKVDVVPPTPSAVRSGKMVEGMRGRIQREISEILNVPIRIGKYKAFFRNVLGVFKVRPEVIRLRDYGDIETLMHEVGHKLQKLMFGGHIRNRDLQPWSDELKPLAKGISTQDALEGFAEFMRRFVTNPDVAKEKAPRFWDFITHELKTKYPDVDHMLVQARANYKVYLEAGPEARFRSNISTKPTQSWAFADKFRQFLTDVIDDLSPLEHAQIDIISSSLGLDAPPRWRWIKRARWMREVERQTKWDQSASELAANVRGAFGLAHHILKNGMIDWNTGHVVGKSLEAIFRPVKDPQQWEEFMLYAIARRANELHGRGKETGFTPEDTRHVLQKYGDREHFRVAFEELQDYQKGLLQILVDARVLDARVRDHILETNEQYLPFHRVLDDELVRRQAAGSIYAKLFNPVKRLTRKGSARTIINPFETIIKNTVEYVRLARRQQVAESLLELSKLDKAGGWIEGPIAPPAQVTKFKLADIAKQLESIFGERLDLEGLSKAEAEEMGQQLLAIYRPGDYFGKDNMISVLRGDKRLWFEVDPELYNAAMGINAEQANRVFRLISGSWLPKGGPAAWLRAGATLALEFIGRNPVKDQFTAYIQSEYGYKFGYDFFRGLFHVINGRAGRLDKVFGFNAKAFRESEELYRQWQRSGGERASLLELDRDSMGKMLRDVLDVPRTKGELVHDILWSPIELLRILSAAAEDATRLGEFARAVKVEGTTAEGLERAAAASRKVTVDFARHGAKTEGLRLTAAFWNARVQSYSRTIRALRTNPGRSAMKIGLSITLPSILFFYANKDDEEYWAKPQWERDLFWHVKIRGTYYRIPKPFELGYLFGTVPEHILEALYTKDPAGLERSLFEMVKSEATSFVPFPTSLVPLVSNFFNWNSFRRTRVVPADLERVQDPFQFTDNTSDLAKWVGRKINYSPAKIDNLFYGYGGGTARLATDIVDVGLQQTGLFPESFPKKGRPSRTKADIPFVRGFVSRPAGRQAEDVERFYTAWNKAQEAKATRDLLTREQRFDELRPWQRKPENQRQLQAYQRLKGAADMLRTLREQAALVRRSESLSPDEKRTRMDRIGQQIRRVASRAVGRRTPVGQSLFGPYRPPR